MLAVACAHENFADQEDYGSRLLFAGIGGGAALLYAVVGLLIARAERRNAIAWIFLVAGALLAGVLAAFGYVDFVATRDLSWPAVRWVEALGNTGFIPAVFVPPALVAQLFPDGRPLPGWRWVLWATVVIAALSTVAGALDPLALDPEDNPVGAPGVLGDLATALNDGSGAFLAPAVFVASLAALVVRLRRSRGIERQQLKFLAFAGAMPVSAFALSFIVLAVSGGVLVDVLFVIGFASLMLIPVAVAVAILRYRLYEIDRVISRTLVYGVLTLVLGAAYAGLVLAGQAVFSSFAGGSDLAIAVSTLLVAALFLPLRAWVQRVVDRRFYRRRYDAQRTLDVFAGRLREQVELDRLRADLEAVVLETVQPAGVSVWLRREARS